MVDTVLYLDGELFNIFPVCFLPLRQILHTFWRRSVLWCYVDALIEFMQCLREGFGFVYPIDEVFRLSQEVGPVSLDVAGEVGV